MKTLILCLIISFICFSGLYGQNHAPVAVNDTITGFVGDTVIIASSFLYKNDYDPDGDSFSLKHSTGFQKINDTTYKIVLGAWASLDVYDSLISYYRYDIEDSQGTLSTIAKLIVRIRGCYRYDSVDVNNLNARISPFGNDFCDFQNFPSRYSLPKNSGKSPVYNQSLWFTGQDENDTVHFAAENTRVNGSDYYPGPVSDSYDNSYKLKWNRVWKLSRNDIRYHIENRNKPGYIPIEAIRDWPVKGEAVFNQSQDIAPFYDSDHDGIYAPFLGDYPLIRGDQAVYFVYNDIQGKHGESHGMPLGIEVHGMAYAFDRPDDSLLSTSLFFHLDIINRSAKNYHNCYEGVFTDFMLGSYDDDFAGCDVTNGMVYSYNASAVDGYGESFAYGEHPPAFGMKIIGGPYLDADGLDNPADDCQYSLNGLNFGDGIADNERSGLSHFNLVEFENYSEILRPEYLYFQNRYGTNKWHPVINLMSNYLFPGDSDTLCNWGTAGVRPYGGYYQNGYYWVEDSIYTKPGLRRSIASIGPFNMDAGQSVPLDYCYSWARDYHGDNLSSVDLLRQRIAGLKSDLPDLISLPQSYTGIEENKTKKKLNVYPNPTHDIITITKPAEGIARYLLYNLSGSCILSGELLPGANTLNLWGFPAGIYVLRCGVFAEKIIKI